jgi:pyruvate/2-oxoglutarate dehydrogenase complex dihydrolipoamide acyltransferase (E2) component
MRELKMPHFVVLEKYGYSDEGLISEWTKRAGDRVEEGELIGVVETEKVAVEIESPANGIFYPMRPKGSVVSVNEEIACILEPGESPEDFAGLPKPTEESEVKKEMPSESMKSFGASPLAKRTAKTYGIDISKLQGTGPKGMITRKDVDSYVGKISEPVKEQITGKDREEIVSMDRETVIPLVGWRKTMSERMLLSTTTAAQITTFAEVDATELVRTRQELKQKTNAKITYTAFIVRAVTLALQEFRILNSSLVDDKIVVKNYYNIGIAMERETGGLIVPIIYDAQNKNLIQLADYIQSLRQKADRDSISLEDVRDGTFTITNVGMLGVLMNTPIINPPQSAILGIGAIVRRPVVLEGNITIRWVIYLSLTYDHRIVDGAPAIRFLQRLKQLLENPQRLLEADSPEDRVHL